MTALEITATTSKEVQSPHRWGSSANLLKMSSIADSDGLAHDAGNLLAALGLYCDLLSRPGVVAKDCQHYVAELRHLSERSSSLIRRFLIREEKIVPVRSRAESAVPEDGWPVVGGWRGIPPSHAGGEGVCRQMANAPASHAHVGEILRSSAGLIERLAGPKVKVQVEGAAVPDELLLPREDLERILVNLTCNAAAAMPDGGSLRITLQQGSRRSFLAGGAQLAGARNGQVLLCVQDSGPGMPTDVAERASSARFASGLGIHVVPAGNCLGSESVGMEEIVGAVSSTGTSSPVNARELERSPNLAQKTSSTQRPRGFGLRIVRELVESAGGTIRFVSRPGAGTRVEMEWPVIRRKGCQQGLQAAESGTVSGSSSVVGQGAAPEATRLERTRLESTRLESTRLLGTKPLQLKPLQLKSNRVFHRNLEYSFPRRNTMPFPTQGPVIPGQLVRGVQTRQQFSLVVATATKDCGSC